MIIIQKSPTADTRSCDFSKVSQEQLLASSHQHIGDVQRVMMVLVQGMCEAAQSHDWTKISNIREFHDDFKTGFETQEWYKMHKAVERHHIASDDGVRPNVNLVDVMEHIVDCVVAGIARTGEVTPLKVSSETLQLAFQNTVEIVKAQVRLEGKIHE